MLASGVLIHNTWFVLPIPELNDRVTFGFTIMLPESDALEQPLVVVTV